jgi:hypothetical protein
MSLHPLVSFNRSNRRLILLLVASHLVWCCAVIGLWSTGQLISANFTLWSGVFLAVQLYAAAQLILPALLFHPEARNRGFYLFWIGALLALLWLVNLFPYQGPWQLVGAVMKSASLLLVATLVGAALARYLHRLWQIVPVCVVMTLADSVSWLMGPTSGFARQIETYYRTLDGPPPMIDMFLVKLAFPGVVNLFPAFGVSDWIMVVFFALVARQHGVDDNLIGGSGESIARRGRIGAYLPVPVVALFLAGLLAQTTGRFIPALPVIALVMLCWYGIRHLVKGAEVRGKR